MANVKASILGMVSIVPSQVVLIPNLDHVRFMNNMAPAVRVQHADGTINFTPIMLFDASTDEDLNKVREIFHQKIDNVFDEYKKLSQIVPVQSGSGNVN